MAAEFDDKVTDLLVQRLSVRERFFYCGKAEALSLALQQGTATKHECKQEIFIFLFEIINPKILTLEVEVANALSLRDNESGNILDGLFYLFKAEINGNLVKECMYSTLSCRKF